MEKTRCCLSAESYIYLDELHLGVWETISPIEVFCIILFSSIVVVLLFMQFHFFFYCEIILCNSKSEESFLYVLPTSLSVFPLNKT